MKLKLQCANLVEKIAKDTAMRTVGKSIPLLVHEVVLEDEVKAKVKMLQKQQKQDR